MNHHRKPTSRYKNRRIEGKRARAAVRSALNGRKPKVVRGISWGYRPDQPPLIDEVPKGHPKRRQKKPKRNACIVDHNHQFLKDIGVFERDIYDWQEQKFHTEQVIRRYRMCVHCGLVQNKGRSPWGNSWYRAWGRLIRTATEEEKFKM